MTAPLAAVVLAEWLIHICLVWLCCLMELLWGIAGIIKDVCFACVGGTSPSNHIYNADGTSSSLEEIQITTAIYPLTPCQTVGMSQACADHPPPTSTPTSLQISPRLSPRPPTSPKKKNNPGITSRPQPRTMSSFCIYCSVDRGEESAEGWQLFEGVEGGGCEGGQCHTKGGQEGKISHPWSVWQRTPFGGGGGDVHSGAVNK